MALKAGKEVVRIFNETDCGIAVICAHPLVIKEIISKTKPGMRIIPKLPGKRVFLMQGKDMHIEHIDTQAADDAEELIKNGAEELK